MKAQAQWEEQRQSGKIFDGIRSIRSRNTTGTLRAVCTKTGRNGWHITTKIRRTEVHVIAQNGAQHRAKHKAKQSVKHRVKQRSAAWPTQVASSASAPRLITSYVSGNPVSASVSSQLLSLCHETQKKRHFVSFLHWPPLHQTHHAMLRESLQLALCKPQLWIYCNSIGEQHHCKTAVQWHRHQCIAIASTSMQ